MFGGGTPKYGTQNTTNNKMHLKARQWPVSHSLSISELQGFLEGSTSISHPPSISLAPILPVSLLAASCTGTRHQQVQHLTYFHLQILVQEEVAQLEVPVNDLIAVQVLAAQDYLPQIVARLGFRQRFPPLVQLQEGLRKREDVTEAQGNGWPAGCGQD